MGLGRPGLRRQPHGVLSRKTYIQSLLQKHVLCTWGGTCIRGKGQEEEGQDSLSVWICHRTIRSTSLKKMQLIFVCKPDLKQHPVQGVRRSVRFRKPPLFLPPLLTLAVMPPNLIPRVLPQVARAPSGWPLGLRVLVGWVRRNRCRCLGLDSRGPGAAQNHLTQRLAIQRNPT